MARARAMIASAVALTYSYLQRYPRRRAMGKRDRQTAKCEHEQWAAHRPERAPSLSRQHQSGEPNDEVFKHRLYAQDAWLKLVGYFKKQKLPM